MTRLFVHHANQLVLWKYDLEPERPQAVVNHYRH